MQDYDVGFICTLFCAQQLLDVPKIFALEFSTVANGVVGGTMVANSVGLIGHIIIIIIIKILVSIVVAN